MSDSGFASLGPSLLARKGGARPAMRPQVAPLVTPLEAGDAGIPEDQLEDLGWNDMGETAGEAGADIVPISPDLAATPATAGPGPIVRRQQRRLEQRVLADAVMTGPEDREPDYDESEEDGAEDEAGAYDAAAIYSTDNYAKDEDEADTAGLTAPLAPPAPVSPRKLARPRVPAAQSGRRAAFTLRLDTDRHLKLRLAATVQGVSAQTLVTEALDRLLAEYDELDVIANHLKRH